LDIQFEKGIYDSDRGVEQQFENHHGTAHRHCEGKKEQNAIELGKDSLSVAGHGPKQGKSDIDRNKIQGETECVSQACLKGFTDKKPGIVFQTYEGNPLSALGYCIETVCNGEQKGPVTEQKSQKEGRENHEIGFCQMEGLFVHAYPFCGDTTAFFWLPARQNEQ
jgi:hypothetical protein